MNMFSKRILPVAMAFLILIGALTIVVSGAGATNTHTVSTVNELNNALSEIGASGTGTITVSTVDKLNNALSEIGASGTGTIVLDADLSNVSGITIGNDQKVTLLGNGHTISFASKTCLSVSGNAVLNLGESGNPASTLDLTRADSNDDPGVLSLSGSATVNMYDGVTIRDAKNNNYFGGGVTIGGQSSIANHAVFTMYGGTIKSCGVDGGSVAFGGGVSVCNGGTFVMNGGTISDCYATTSSYSNPTSDNATGSGGGVFVGSGSSFVMNDGIINNCIASTNGGGVAIYTSAQSELGNIDSEFTMNGGTIGNCVCEGMGGGIYATGRIVNVNAIAAPTGAAGTVTNKGLHILGGSVTNNTAGMLGGGIGLFLLSRNGLVAEIKNTNITRNSAPEGGGIGSLLYWTRFDVDNCVITDNTAQVGGGIAIDGYEGSNVGNKPIASVTNTTIGNNLASVCASDVYVFDAQMTLNSAENSKILYTNTQPTDLSNRTIEQWYVDGGERFVKQAPEDRVVRTQLNLTWSSKNEHMLIAAPTPNSPQGSGRAQFVLTKDFVIKDGYDGAGTSVPDVKDMITSDPVFTIKKLISFHRVSGKDPIADIPAFAEDSYTIPVRSGVNSITIALPDFTAYGVGDYWYTVTEQPLLGVGFGEDEINPRYLHIQVVWGDEAHTFTVIANISLHKTAPDDDGTYLNGNDEKTTGFINTFGAGSLTVTKKVSGNMADPNKLFKVTVTLSTPDDKSVMNTVSYSGGYADENGLTALDGTIDPNWNGSKSVTVYLKDESTVTFKNIPDGVVYTVTEADVADEWYEAEYKIRNGETGEDKVLTNSVSGKISDAVDDIIITNVKEVALDVGVILQNTPFVILLIGGIVVLIVLLVFNRRNKADDDDM